MSPIRPIGPIRPIFLRLTHHHFQQTNRRVPRTMAHRGSPGLLRSPLLLDCSPVLLSRCLSVYLDLNLVSDLKTKGDQGLMSPFEFFVEPLSFLAQNPGSPSALDFAPGFSNLKSQISNSVLPDPLDLPQLTPQSPNPVISSTIPTQSASNRQKDRRPTSKINPVPIWS